MRTREQQENLSNAIIVFAFIRKGSSLDRGQTFTL